MSEDYEMVRLYPGRDQEKYLREQFSILGRSEAYRDTRIICSDGVLEVNSMLAGLGYPELYTCSSFVSFPVTRTVLVPDFSLVEVEERLSQVLVSTSNESHLVKDEYLLQSESSPEEIFSAGEEDVELEHTKLVKPTKIKPKTGKDKKEKRFLDRQRTDGKSIVWDYFNTVAKAADEDEISCREGELSTVDENSSKKRRVHKIVQCSLCPAQLKFHRSTASLYRHIQRCHKNILLPSEDSSELPKKQSCEESLLQYFHKTEGSSLMVLCSFCNQSCHAKPYTRLKEHLLKQHIGVLQSSCYVCTETLKEDSTFINSDSAPAVPNTDRDYLEPESRVQGDLADRSPSRSIRRRDDKIQRVPEKMISTGVVVDCSGCGCRFHVDCVDSASTSWCPICFSDEAPRPPMAKVVRTRIGAGGGDGRSSVCPECGKEIKDINRHIRRFHLGLSAEAAVQCELCKRVFKRKCNLTEHMRMVHQKLIRFSCKFCQRGFYNRTQLKRHVRIMHMNEKSEGQVSCPDCGKEMLRSTLKKHLRVVHQGLKTDDRAFCDECGKQFTQRGSLFIHMRKTHGKEPEVNRNKSNHNKAKFFVDPHLIVEAYPELKTSVTQ